MLAQLKPFQDSQHRPFFWAGAEPAALLLHGFPGTPAEMRPLAALLHEAGWTVQGLLLPGFGPQIETLGDKDYADWRGAAATALRQLKQSNSPVMLIGYSMGAAIALDIAAEHHPDGLILLAPFRRFGNRWHQLLGFLLKPFFKTVAPFKTSNFDDPQVRQSIANFFPEADLSDPDVQQSLRELRLPTRIFEQLNRAGKGGVQAAPQVTAPTLIIQGLHDDIVPHQQTRQLLQRLPGPVSYLEVDAGHELLNTGHPAWSQITTAVSTFGRQQAEVEAPPVSL